MDNVDRLPVDLEARELAVRLAGSGPRWLSSDGEFAIWSATVGEEREGEPVTLRGPLGQVAAGEQLVVVGAFERHARYGGSLPSRVSVWRCRSLRRVWRSGCAAACPGSARSSADDRDA